MTIFRPEIQRVSDDDVHTTDYRASESFVSTHSCFSNFFFSLFFSHARQPHQVQVSRVNRFPLRLVLPIIIDFHWIPITGLWVRRWMWIVIDIPFRWNNRDACHVCVVNCAWRIVLLIAASIVIDSRTWEILIGM